MNIKEIETIGDIPEQQWDWLINHGVCEKLGITEEQLFRDYKNIFDNDRRIQSISDFNNRSIYTLKLLKEMYRRKLSSINVKQDDNTIKVIENLTKAIENLTKAIENKN